MISQLYDLLDDYRELETYKSLNSEITKQREKIEYLIKELDRIKNYNYSIQKKYENELAALRKIMRSLVYQIDSLEQIIPK